MPTRRGIIWGTMLALVIVLVAAGAFVVAQPASVPEIQARLSVFEALGSNDLSRFSRAVDPRTFSFPDDHGPHPDFGIEWWYYTGNLDAEDGRHFGFELTFFRVATTPEEEQPSGSAWRSSQFYVAHFGLTDVKSGKFHSFERFSRDAIGLAGARAQPFRVWLEDWAVESTGPDTSPMRLRASDEGVSIDLTLDAKKPLVLQGDAGLSRKGADIGNASYYYSMTRMPTEGTVRIGDASFQVTGTSWMDREWSTSAVTDNQVGWDWFALQLSDGREIMFYQLRQRDGSVDPFSSGTLIMPDGSARHLKRDDVRIEVLDEWQSPRGGSPYPSRWRVSIPSESLELDVRPYIANQEMNVSVRYWEGAVHFEGTSQGEPITGSGYVEMTGYADDAGGRS